MSDGRSPGRPEMRRRLGTIPPRGRLVVALSGGRDSVVLLHLLRFGGVEPARLVAAHLDHGMRQGSAADADWVRGLCTAWQVPLVEARIVEPPGSEAGARAARWAFLDGVRKALDAVAVVTAHHADDQAETVLHHVARGTGLRGLGAMRPVAGGRVRPLLGVPRAALGEHARRAGIGWREDPTNADAAFTRNRVRHEVLPALEAAVPGTRRALVRLARVARNEEAALAEAVARAVEGVVRDSSPGRLVLDRGGLLSFGAPLRARILRAAARRLGGRLDASGTRVALAFTTGSSSGREVHLTGAMRLARELDALVLEAPGSAGQAGGSATAVGPPGIDPVELHPREAGRLTLRVAGERVLLHWGPVQDGGSGDPRWRAGLDAAALGGPLRVRPWRPGDRIEMPYGTKKLKKLLAEARLDRERRRGHPVVEDATGRIVWVPGIVDAVSPAVRGTTFHLWIRHDARP